MFIKLRLCVPKFGVLITAVTFVTSFSSVLSRAQLWATVPNTFQGELNIDVSQDTIEISVDHCTEFEQSCVDDRKMNFSCEQKQIISNLYKCGRKKIKTESHVQFLSKCLEKRIIPECFTIKNSLPGNKVSNQKKLDDISYGSMADEKNRQNWKYRRLGPT